MVAFRATIVLVNEYKINDVIPIHNCPKGDNITLHKSLMNLIILSIVWKKIY
jgi:hypothetical protein